MKVRSIIHKERQKNTENVIHVRITIVESSTIEVSLNLTVLD